MLISKVHSDVFELEHVQLAEKCRISEKIDLVSSSVEEKGVSSFKWNGLAY